MLCENCTCPWTSSRSSKDHHHRHWVQCSAAQFQPHIVRPSSASHNNLIGDTMELIINKSPFTWQSLNFCDLLWTPLSILLFLFSSDHSIASSSESQAINKRNGFPWTPTARKGTIYFIYTCNLLIPIFNKVTTTKTTAKLLNGLVLRAPRNLMGIDIKPKLNWKPSLWPRKWETINKFSSQVKRATFTWSEGMGPESVRTGEKRPICRDKSHFIHQLFLNLSIGWRPTATKESATVFWYSSSTGERLLALGKRSTSTVALFTPSTTRPNSLVLAN